MDTELENMKKMVPQLTEAIRENPDIVDWLRLTIGEIENFSKEFVSQLKEKTKEPHEHL